MSSALKLLDEMNLLINTHDLVLITTDDIKIKYNSTEFSKISDLFKEHVNCTSFKYFKGVNNDGSINYTVDTTYDILDWVLNTYYSLNPLNDDNFKVIFNISFNNSLKIYKFALDMKMTKLVIDCERFFENGGLKRLCNHIMPIPVINKHCCFKNEKAQIFIVQSNNDVKECVLCKEKMITFNNDCIYMNRFTLYSDIIDNLRYKGYFEFDEKDEKIDNGIDKLNKQILYNYSTYTALVKDVNNNKDKFNDLLEYIKSKFSEKYYISLLEYYAKL